MKTVTWLALVSSVLLAAFLLAQRDTPQVPERSAEVAPPSTAQTNRPDTAINTVVALPTYPEAQTVPKRAEPVNAATAEQAPGAERSVEAASSASGAYPTTKEMARVLHRAFFDDKERTMSTLAGVMDREKEDYPRDREQEANVREALDKAIADGRIDSSALQSLTDISCYPSLCRLEYGGGLQSPPVMQSTIREASGFPLVLATTKDGGQDGWEMFAIREMMVFHIPDLFRAR